MKTKIITIFSLALVLTAFTVADIQGIIVTESEFKDYIDTLGIKFSMPENYKATYVKENRDLGYHFAIKNTKADFEVRYTIWPLAPMFEQFEKCKLDSNCTMINPNVIYKGLTMANVLNMTGGKNSGIGPFPTEAVKKEFNADAGGSSFFELDCEFGKGYKYGQMVYLHKDNVADIIITYLSNDKEKHSGLMQKPFHALTFK